jgi:hypothetical protein
MILLLLVLGDAEIIAPTLPGLEYTLPANGMHYTLPDSKMEYTIPTNGMHYTFMDED